MKISPLYDKIKFRAVEMLVNPAGFNGHSLDEMRSWKRGDSVLRNSIGVALCYARDEFEIPTRTPRLTFNKGNFRKASAEIARTITGNAEIATTGGRRRRG